MKVIIFGKKNIKSTASGMKVKKGKNNRGQKNRKKNNVQGVVKSNPKKESVNIKRLKDVLNKQKSFPSVDNKTVAPHASKSKVRVSIAEEAKLRLESAHFRYLNEQLYTSKSDAAWALFQEDPKAFDIYHKGFQNQVAKWPVNPLDVIIKDLQKRPKTWVVADFGCGEARLALSLPEQTVHSFDLVAANERVTACDMANVPLTKKSVDAVVFCLSLMGHNLQEFLTEANRVLKIGGMMYLAEVESRCSDIEGFLKSTEKFGFRLKEYDAKSYRFFFLARFVKTSDISPKATLPRMHLKACLYKKR